MNDIITNGTEIKQRILSEINNANQNIFIAMAWFTDRDIANALIEAKNRNLIIDIILSSNIQNDTVKLMLKVAGINVHAFETGDNRGIMHHKFCLIDNKISINGSYNFSYNASNNNVENIHVTDDLTTYNQLLTEFERLKYTIDNNLEDQSTIKIPMNNFDSQKPFNIIDLFSQQLNSLVYSAAQINTDEYKKRGYQTSKESLGHVDIFRTEINNIQEEIKAFATDDGLSSKKNVLTSNIHNAYESTKTNLDIDKQEKISIEKRNYELEKKQISEKSNELKLQKSLYETGDSNTGEKGLFQINKEIEINKLESKTTEQTLIVKKFWTIGTIFVLLGMCIFIFYLSIFFSSALYKVFFEANVIRAMSDAGAKISLPQIVDANAVIKIFRQQGGLFGAIAALFFLIPVLLSNLKILGSENKKLNRFLFWVGLLIFDIIVAIMDAKNTDEIKNLLKGTESTLQIWEVFKLGEFWLIFVFGMFPLIITHFLIEFIIKAYKNSQRDIIDSEKSHKIKILNAEMIELISLKEAINGKIIEKNSKIMELNSNILNLDTEFNNLLGQIDNKFSDLQKQIKSIYDDFNSKVISGKIFTEVIFSSIVSAYKSGFIEYLPEYYAADEVAIRVKGIDNVITNN